MIKDNFNRTIRTADKTVINISAQHVGEFPECELRAGISPFYFLLTTAQVKKLIKALQAYLTYREKQ
jgi:hypothetical protein